jgi:copper homeostasis protein
MKVSVNPVPADRRPLLEVCAGSLDDRLSAQAAGADGIGLCSVLDLGGLSPSIGLVKQDLGRVSLLVIAMIRSNAAGFAYSPRKLWCMQSDAKRMLRAVSF